MKHMETSIDDPKQETTEKSGNIASSQLHNNSIRSTSTNEDDSFFLPFDEDLEATPEDSSKENERAFPQFHKLHESDRAHSMPIEQCMTKSQSQSSFGVGLTRSPLSKRYL
jgi:hypothetical protein